VTVRAHAVRVSGDNVVDPLAPFFPQGATPPEFLAMLDAATHKTYGQHGVSAFTAPREAALVHEAGHAVVATHEGLAVRSVSVFRRGVPPLEAWGGWCAVDGTSAWRSGPDTTVENDLSAARIVISGLVGELACRLDKAGSSLDEIILSQTLAVNAAIKLGMATDAQGEQLWNERVWRETFAILRENWDAFNELVAHLDQAGKLKGGKLRRVLGKVRRRAASCLTRP
jgi:hypothetical protein